MSKMRNKLGRKQSKKLFRRTASKYNSKNLMPAPMRGGYRL